MESVLEQKDHSIAVGAQPPRLLGRQQGPLEACLHIIQAERLDVAPA